jgi:hypothetical protein
MHRKYINLIGNPERKSTLSGDLGMDGTIIKLI